MFESVSRFYKFMPSEAGSDELRACSLETVASLSKEDGVRTVEAVSIYV